MRKRLFWGVGVVGAFIAAVNFAYITSPWPSALVVRAAFDKEANAMSQALAKHLPQSVEAQLDQRYDEADGDARLDVFYPAAAAKDDRALTTVVWVHSGGWISGTKNQIANYARILADKGFTVVGVNTSSAPGAHYPAPLKQVNAALAYLDHNAKRLHVDPSRFVLAGDSGGAHIVAQVANLVSVPDYAKALGIAPAIARPQLRGVVLYSGAYDLGQLSLEGKFGDFNRTVLWSYFGEKDFSRAPLFPTASVIHYLTADFPPAFVSVGNDDPLGPQSRALAAKLAGLGVPVDALFFADDAKPAVPHEYQFSLDTAAGRQALERSAAFIRAR